MADMTRARVSRSTAGAAAISVAVAVGAAVWVAQADVTHIDEPAQPAGTDFQPADRLTPPGTNRSLRFYGAGTGQIDRVRVPLGGTTQANVGATDFTVEFWIKGALADNPASGCSTANDAWINGHIVIDRDVYNAGDYGDFGISLLGGTVAFGASKGSSGATVCGNTTVLDGAWHHVAVTRQSSNGRMRIWVDGALDAQNASSPVTGNVAYRTGRSTSFPADPTLVFGAEKHDAGSAYPSFDGFLDEVRLSTSLRYAANFTRPSGRFTVDAATAALWHFDEGTGTAVADAKGTSPGTLLVGGSPAGPMWATDVPFA